MFVSARRARDFGGISIYPRPTPAKTVIHSKDEFEQEADRVSEQVMKVDLAKTQTVAGYISARVPVAGTHQQVEVKQVRTGVSGPDERDPSAAPSLAKVALENAGQPLDGRTLRVMEQRFGHNFSRVRIHADGTAAALSRSLNARALTTGSDIVFAAGEYAPETSRGGLLLAHELTHVLQQGFGETSRVVQLKGNDAAPTQATAPGSPPKGETEVFAASAAIQANWNLLASLASKYDLLKPWVNHGNAVITLIRAHTAAGLAAIHAKDSVLLAAYRMALRTDKVTYDYIAWHVTAYVNLLSLKSAISSLVNSFDHDNRRFSGRANAERIARQFKTGIDGVQAHSDSRVTLIRVNVPLGVRSGSPNAATITVTSPAIDAEVEAIFKKSTEEMQRYQRNVQEGAEVVNQFLDQAAVEGAEQALDALVEYALVRTKLSGNADKSSEPQRRQEPHPVPVPVVSPDPGDDKKRRRKRPPFVLRLPQQKAPHLTTYRAWLGTLQSDPLYERGSPAQLEKWHQALRIGGSHGIPAEVYERGHTMGFTGERGERQIRVPNWTRNGSVSMEVDHIIELQVTPPAMRVEFNSVANYELLDETSNGSSGPLLSANIASERAKQVAFDPTAAGRVLIFDSVEINGGSKGERWGVEELRAGAQLDALGRGTSK